MPTFKFRAEMFIVSHFYAKRDRAKHKDDCDKHETFPNNVTS